MLKADESEVSAAVDSRPAWSFGLPVFRRFPPGSGWVGVGIFVAYMALWIVVQNLIGMLDGFRLARSLGSYAGGVGQPVWLSPLGWFEVVNATLISYLFAAGVYVRRGAFCDLAALRPTLRLTDAEYQVQREEMDLSRVEVFRLVGLGVGVGLAITFFDAGIWAGHERPPLGDPYLFFVAVRMAVVGVLFALLAKREFNLARSFLRLGESHLNVNLLDLRPLQPFARKGQRSVIVWMLALAIFSLFFLGPEPGWTNFGTLIFGVVVAATGFLLPVLGVRRSIILAKGLELDRLGLEIDREREKLFPETREVEGEGSSPPAAMDARLSNLLAYKTLIDGVREWPVGASTLARIAVFMTIGVGSWVGSAVVERLLSSALE